MFDATLGRAQAQPTRLRQGAVLSIGAHALAVAFLWMSPRSAPQVRHEPEVKFVMPKPAPPPLGGAAVQDKPQPQAPRKIPKKNAFALAPDRPLETHEQPDEPQEPAGEGGDPNGQPGEQAGSTPGGTCEGGGCTLSATTLPAPAPPPLAKPTVVSFDAAKMVRPVLVSGSPPEYPSRARAARIETAVLVQCVVTTEGTLHNCRVLKGHPLLNDAVLTALAGQRYRPALYAGKPIRVGYVFTFRFKLQ